jgi:glycosyltransferase involved in cell wall biosynthesis
MRVIKMKVLFTGVINHPRWPGGEPRVAKLLASGISQIGGDVTKAFLPRNRPYWKIYPLSSPNIVLDNAVVRAYKNYIEKVRPDVVMSWYDYDLSAYWGSVLSGTPTIVQAQTLWPVCPKADLFNRIQEAPCNGPNWTCGRCILKEGKLSGEFTPFSPSTLMPDKLFSAFQVKKVSNQKSKLRYASAIVSDSLLLKKIMQSLDYNVKNVHVIYNGVDIKSISSTVTCKKKTVLFLSNNASEQKGYRHFIQVSKNLKSEFPDARFLWIGQKDLAGESFETMAYLYNFADLIKEIQSSYLLLLPSLWPEPMSYSVLQAMAHEKPVVAYNVGANSEAIIHNETGLLAEWNNIAELSSYVRLLLLDEKLARKFGQNGKKRINEHFSVEKMMANYRSLLKIVSE